MRDFSLNQIKGSANLNIGSINTLLGQNNVGIGSGIFSSGTSLYNILLGSMFFL